MSEHKETLLKLLEGCELAGITFIRDYVQFQFEDTGSTRGLNAYTWPQVKTENGEFAFAQSGYRDALCSLIDKRIIFADEKNEKLFIQFERGMELHISLKKEDSVCVEAALLRAGLEWEVWQNDTQATRRECDYES